MTTSREDFGVSKGNVTTQFDRSLNVDVTAREAQRVSITMTDLDSGAQVVAENVAMLLRTSRFADSTLTCEGNMLLVHRAIICARSPVWAAAADGTFRVSFKSIRFYLTYAYPNVQEGSTKIVEVEIADLPTLQRALTYLYTGSYNDQSLISFDGTPQEPNHLQYGNAYIAMNTELGEGRETSVQSRDSAAEIEINEGHTSSSSRTGQLKPPDLVQHDETNSNADYEPEDHCQCSKNQSNKPKAVCSNARLRANALVYILADYYQIPGLKRLAVSKFASALEKICQMDFGEVCFLVYKSVPSTALELRSCLSSAIVSYGQQVIEDASFLDTALLLPELLRDILFWSC